MDVTDQMHVVRQFGQYAFAPIGTIASDQEFTVGKPGAVRRDRPGRVHLSHVAMRLDASGRGIDDGDVPDDDGLGGGGQEDGKR